jgi:chromosome segregation ATPase
MKIGEVLEQALEEISKDAEEISSELGKCSHRMQELRKARKLVEDRMSAMKNLVRLLNTEEDDGWTTDDEQAGDVRAAG